MSYFLVVHWHLFSGRYCFTIINLLIDLACQTILLRMARLPIFFYVTTSTSCQSMVLGMKRGSLEVSVQRNCLHLVPPDCRVL